MPIDALDILLVIALILGGEWLNGKYRHWRWAPIFRVPPKWCIRLLYGIPVFLWAFWAFLR